MKAGFYFDRHHFPQIAHLYWMLATPVSAKLNGFNGNMPCLSTGTNRGLAG
jgi:hypothetical protein